MLKGYVGVIGDGVCRLSRDEVESKRRSCGVVLDGDDTGDATLLL